MKDTLEERFLHTVLRRAWTLAKNQARFRKQEWEISYEQYVEIWTEDDAWMRKGFEKNDLCFTRIDVNKGWTLDNVVLDTRNGHLTRNPTVRQRKLKQEKS